MTLIGIVSVLAFGVGAGFIVAFGALGNTRSPYGQSMVASSVVLMLVAVAGVAWSRWVAVVAILAFTAVIAHRTVLLLAANLRGRDTTKES